MFFRRNSLFVVAVAVIAVSSACSEVQAQRAKQLVEEVAVIGNRRFSKEDVLKNVKTKPGEVFSWKQVQRDLQSVLALGAFDKLQTRVLQEPGQRGGVVITFEVEELPLILDVNFEGLRDIKEADLTDVLRQEHLNVTKDAVYDPIQVRKAMRAIGKFLASRGWPDATVTVRQEIGGTYVSITFTIRLTADNLLFRSNLNGQQ